MEAYLPLYYWHFNYHHWLIECLPSLLDWVQNPELQQLQLVLPERLNAFQQATLDLLQIPHHKTCSFGENDVLFDQFWVPSLGNFSPLQLRQVRESLLKAAQIEPWEQESPTQTKRRRLYFSRRDAASRRVSNEADLWSLLRAFQFELLELGGMSLREQMRLMNEAEVIMGPHGAGLSNLVFAPPDCKLIELMPRDTVNHCFWLLSQAHLHTLLCAQSLEAQSSEGRKPEQKYAYLTGD